MEGIPEGGSAPQMILPASGGTYFSINPSWSASGIYNIRVKAVDSTGLSSDWTPDKTMTIGAPPAQPVLTVTVDGSNVTLSWTESSTDVAGFKLYRLPSSGGWSLPEVGGDVRTYTDSSAPAGTNTYYVQAWNLSGGGTDRIYSLISNVVSVTVGGGGSVVPGVNANQLAAILNSLTQLLEQLLNLIRQQTQ